MKCLLVNSNLSLVLTHNRRDLETTLLTWTYQKYSKGTINTPLLLVVHPVSHAPALLEKVNKFNYKLVVLLFARSKPETHLRKRS